MDTASIQRGSHVERALATLLVILAGGLHTFAQPTIEPRAIVGIGPARTAVHEVDVAAHPLGGGDTKLVAIWMAESLEKFWYGVSTDSGQTWVEALAPLPTGFQGGMDPRVTVADDGTFLATYVASTVFYQAEVFAIRMPNGSAVFNAPVGIEWGEAVPSSLDFPVVAWVDPYFYVTVHDGGNSKMYYARSLDGTEWAESPNHGFKTIKVGETPVTGFVANPVAGANGDLLVLYIEPPGAAEPHYRLVRGYENGGFTFEQLAALNEPFHPSNEIYFNGYVPGLVPHPKHRSHGGQSKRPTEVVPGVQ
ncbi:MAG: hypothetical protein KKB50_18620 [Planctomycetes bacterium]|nr:hypothetical protein [Planctomycetota bacterium]